MKKAVTVKVPARPAKAAKPATTKKVTKTVCDFCNASLPSHGSYGWYPSCSICGRDTCRKHNSPDPSEPSDYPDWYCDICHPLIVSAKRELEERHWQEEKELEARIKKESLAKEIQHG